MAIHFNKIVTLHNQLY